MGRKHRERTASERRMLRELGAKLRAARRHAGLTQEVVAERTEIDVKYIQRLESGAFNPEVLTLARYAKAIGLSVWELLAQPVERGPTLLKKRPA